MMWWVLCGFSALAAEPDPVLYRVMNPELAEAEARSASASVVTTRPAEGTPWMLEPLPTLDVWTEGATRDALATEWFHASGHRGAGIKVGVVDLAWFGDSLEAALGYAPDSADCWTHQSCEAPIDIWRPRFGFEQGVHGLACAEIVADIAPEAEVYAVRVNGLTTFENAVEWAIRHDIDILSMSMSFFNTSFYDGRGPFGPLIERLAAHDILLVTSAGNYATQHWHGPWRDTDFDQRADLNGNDELLLDLNRGTRTVYVQWSEFRVCGTSDLSVVVRDRDGHIVGVSDDRQRVDADNCAPTERVQIQAAYSGTYRLSIEANRVAGSGVDLDVFTTSGAIINGTSQMSLTDPASHPMAFVVGAVDVDGYLTNPAEPFSSRGPSRSGALKPDVAGPDGLDTLSFGPGGFFGTSAATPAVAGAIAVLMSSEPGLTAGEAADRLKASAWGNASSPDGYSPDLGAGRVVLPVPDATALGCADGRAESPLWLLLLLLPLRSHHVGERRDL